MKTFIKKSVFVATIVLATSPFISCNSPEEKTTPKSLEIAADTNLVSEKVKEITYRKPIVFIAGFDKGTDTFYSSARTYFQEKGIKIIDGQYSLEEIIRWLNNNADEHPYGEINIVNKSNLYKGMNLETVIYGKKITSKTLKKSITQGTLPTLKNVVNKNSKFIFHASGLVNNKELIKTLRDALSAKELPKIIASPYNTIFGGKFSNYYLAKPYYVFYPTANSPGKIDLSKEIAKKYPKEKEIDWYDALNNENERYVGEAYTTQFNIPIAGEFNYIDSDDEIPTFTTQEEVINWIKNQEELTIQLNRYNIPIEKFRWNWSVKNSKLIIKGKTTGLCVLKPLIKPYGDLKHIKPDINNKRLYTIK